MWRKIAIIGVTAAAVVGTGTAALAVTGSSSAPKPATSTASAAPGAASGTASAAPGAAGKSKRAARVRLGLERLRSLQHATWVTENKKTSTFTTHQAIRGTVGAVSATSITVTSADKVSEIYVVTSKTAVHTKATHKGAKIADVKTGDTVYVAGTGAASPVTATQVVDVSH